MTTLTIPGLVDVHVHTRDPGETHKERWDTATAAALAGGFTTILAMPNTRPPVTDEASFQQAHDAALAGARCDFALYAGATADNAGAVAKLATRTAGLKMYLDSTHGDLRLPDMNTWWEHLVNWPDDRPLVAHAEGASLGAVLLMAEWLERPLHIAHVSRRDEITLIARARDRGLPVTCEVTPHHLILDDHHLERLGGTAYVRPPLASPDDRDALWEHLEAIDCFATDHAPHTLAEKTAPDAPPGYPGLETALPLLLSAVHEGRLTVEDIVARLHTNPVRIFGLSPRPATVTLDLDEPWTIGADDLHTACDWTPFAGMKVRGRISGVTVEGEEMYRNGAVLAPPGTGVDLRDSREERT